MADLGGELVEVPPLDGLQPVGDGMERRVRGRVVPDVRGGAPGVGPVAFERRSITLAPEPGEPDAGLGPRPAANTTDGGGLQADAEDFADPLEVLVDRVPPIVVGAKLALPAAGLFLGGI